MGQASCAPDALQIDIIDGANYIKIKRLQRCPGISKLPTITTRISQFSTILRYFGTPTYPVINFLRIPTQYLRFPNKFKAKRALTNLRRSLRKPYNLWCLLILMMTIKAIQNLAKQKIKKISDRRIRIIPKRVRRSIETLTPLF